MLRRALRGLIPILLASGAFSSTATDALHLFFGSIDSDFENDLFENITTTVADDFWNSLTGDNISLLIPKHGMPSSTDATDPLYLTALSDSLELMTVESDGIIHVLNQPTNVTYSPGLDTNSFEITGLDIGFGTSIGFLLKADVLDNSENQHGITLFLPQNSAYSDANSTLNALDTTSLNSTVKSHAINSTLYSPYFGSCKVTMGGQTLSVNGSTVSLKGGNSGKTLVADILLQNGVIHIIDTVLIPAGASSGLEWLAPVTGLAICLILIFSVDFYTRSYKP